MSALIQDETDFSGFPNGEIFFFPVAPAASDASIGQHLMLIPDASGDVTLTGAFENNLTAFRIESSSYTDRILDMR